MAVRRAILGAVASVAENSKEAIELMMDGIIDHDTESRAIAADCLVGWYFNTVPVYQRLVACANNQEALIGQRIAAIAVMAQACVSAEMMDHGTADCLLSVLQSTSAEVRMAAIAALSSCGLRHVYCTTTDSFKMNGVSGVSFAFQKIKIVEEVNGDQLIGELRLILRHEEEEEVRLAAIKALSTRTREEFYFNFHSPAKGEVKEIVRSIEEMVSDIPMEVIQRMRKLPPGEFFRELAGMYRPNGQSDYQRYFALRMMARVLGNCEMVRACAIEALTDSRGFIADLAAGYLEHWIE